MKLIKSALSTNIDFKNAYPHLAEKVLGNRSVKYIERYSLNATAVLVIHTYDMLNVVLANEKRKIQPKEIEFVKQELLDPTKEIVEKQDMLDQLPKNRISVNYKDVVVLQVEI